MTRWFYASIVLALLAAAASLGVWYFAYDRLPQQLPVHWNIEGVPDGYMDRGSVLVLWPSVLAGWVLLTLALPWLSPKNFKVETFRGTYYYVMALVAALFVYMHVVTLWGGFDPTVQLERWLFGGIFLFFALLGNVLGRVKRNFWVGVRTPWTLASDIVWDRTHRLAAWLFVAFGVFGFVAVLLGLPLMWTFVGLVVPALVPVVYSLVIYKRLERQGQLGNDIS